MNLFGKPSAEPNLLNLFELCRGVKRDVKTNLKIMKRADYLGYVSPTVRPYDVSIERGIAASVEFDTTLEDVGDEKIDVWG